MHRRNFGDYQQRKLEVLKAYYRKSLLILLAISMIYMAVSFTLIFLHDCRTFFIPGNYSSEVQYYASRFSDPSLSDLQDSIMQPLQFQGSMMAITSSYVLIVVHITSRWTHEDELFVGEFEYLRDTIVPSLFYDKFCAFTPILLSIVLSVWTTLFMMIYPGCPSYSIHLCVIVCLMFIGLLTMLSNRFLNIG